MEGSWILGAKSWNILFGSVGNVKPLKGLDVIKLIWGKLHGERTTEVNWLVKISDLKYFLHKCLKQI